MTGKEEQEETSIRRTTSELAGNLSMLSIPWGESIRLMDLLDTAAPAAIVSPVTSEPSRPGRDAALERPSTPGAVHSLPGIFMQRGRAAAENVFRKEGEYWTIAYEGATVRLKDAKGLRYLACLLRDPGREFHVADLAAATQKWPADILAPLDGVEHDLRGRGLDPGGTALDRGARAEYRRRLEELRQELDEAQRCHDLGRAAKVRAELDFIASELAAAYGLGGRARKDAAPMERLRKAISNRIRDSLAKIRTAHPSLGRHLFSSVKPGVFCVYTPERLTAWHL